MAAVAVERIGSEKQASSLRAAVVAAGARWSAGQRQLVRLVAELDASGEWVRRRLAHVRALGGGRRSTSRCAPSASGCASVAMLVEPADRSTPRSTKGGCRTASCGRSTRIATPENEAELCEIAERVPAGRLRTRSPRGSSGTRRRTRPRRATHGPRALVADSTSTAWASAASGCHPQPWRSSQAAVDAEVMRRRPVGTRPRTRRNRARVADGCRSNEPTRSIELVRGAAPRSRPRSSCTCAATVARLDDGTPIADSVVERIAPDCVPAGPHPRRGISPDQRIRPSPSSHARQRRVVHERDRVCVDCGSSEFLQYDHEPDYEQSRRTVVDELRLRCRTCHRARHRRARARPPSPRSSPGVGLRRLARSGEDLVDLSSARRRRA